MIHLHTLKLHFVFVALAVLLCPSARAEIRTQRAPEGEPQSSYWSVQLENTGEELEPLVARVNDPPFDNYDYGGEYAFLSLDADEPVSLVLTEKSGANLDSFEIRPKSLKLDYERLNDHQIRVRVDRPCQISAEYNNRVHPLLIFVNPLEQDAPDQNDPNVKYYGPGVHEPEDGIVSLEDNQTLYLAPGAIVKCGVSIHGENIKVCGRGVIDSNPWEWRKGPTPFVVAIEDSKNVTIEGVVIRGASHWTLVPVNSDNITINNVKICGGRVQNDDGINPCNSRNVRVSNCFIRTDDDCLALKGLDESYGNCEDVSVENCVLWCDRARIALLGHESRAPYMRRITFRDIDVIHAQTRNFLLEPGENMRLEDVLFDNIRFESSEENAIAPETLEKMKKLDASNLRFDIDVDAKDNWILVARPAVNRYMKTQEPGYIRGLTFRNIVVDGETSYCGILVSGANEEHKTEKLTIENVQIFDEKLDRNSPRLHIGDFTGQVDVH